MERGFSRPLGLRKREMFLGSFIEREGRTVGEESSLRGKKKDFRENYEGGWEMREREKKRGVEYGRCVL